MVPNETKKSSAKMSYPFSILIISKRFHYNSEMKLKKTIKIVFNKIPLDPQKFENMLRNRKYSEKDQLGKMCMSSNYYGQPTLSYMRKRISE